MDVVLSERGRDEGWGLSHPLSVKLMCILTNELHYVD